MFLKWLPWKFLVQRAARRYGVLDPITLLARMRRFAQPSEVAEPLDLLRAGIVFHARGMINTRAIQYNLDWLWPYWVERQFSPGDHSFIPRAFSLSHINLTHRNWTAVGRPDVPHYPIVDPRGLVTPLYDSWSIDTWLLTEDGRILLPSRLTAVDQHLDLSADWVVETRSQLDDLALVSRVSIRGSHEKPRLAIELLGRTGTPAWLIVAIRPYNPEGVQFVHSLAMETPQRLRVNHRTAIDLDPAPDKVLFSIYHEGDVFNQLDQDPTSRQVRCTVGMATAAVFFAVPAASSRQIGVSVGLSDELHREPRAALGPPRSWAYCLDTATRMQLPDERMQYLFDAAVRTLILLSAGEVVPGPYTYRRFWYRDAVIMLNAMLALNLSERCRLQLDQFFERQHLNGYFASQRGEWDSNGQVLWLFDRFQRVAPERFNPGWMEGILKGARWIRNKRRRSETGPHAGLLPAGFSAEHFGPNDYYYWDDFWSIAGLYGAARLAGLFANQKKAAIIMETARDLEQATYRSIAAVASKRSCGAIPASPYRRMDAGAIGALVADYPLQLMPPGDERIHATVEFLMAHCLFEGGFFQDMIHSGINVYLTLDIAQTLLRHGDARYRALMETAAHLASGTGQWPEAIHPATLGGCMGDGHHGWAAAEWVMMIRNCFVREEQQELIIGAGLFEEWLAPGRQLSFGPTQTRFGSVSIIISTEAGGCRITLDSRWIGAAPRMLVRMPGFEEKTLTAGSDWVARRNSPTQ